jgi:hypothetical protein
MSSRTRFAGALLASTVAGLFVASTALAQGRESREGKVKCEGVTPADETTGNACGGPNGCGAPQEVWLTPEECEAAKAKIEAERKKSS